jgi:hypothetical protein
MKDSHMQLLLCCCWDCVVLAFSCCRQQPTFWVYVGCLSKMLHGAVDAPEAVPLLVSVGCTAQRYWTLLLFMQGALCCLVSVVQLDGVWILLGTCSSGV